MKIVHKINSFTISKITIFGNKDPINKSDDLINNALNTLSNANNLINSIEYEIRCREKTVHGLMEESVILRNSKDATEAVEVAKQVKQIDRPCL